ncbi:MAG: DUF262 domain-containing protein [Planctomycetaceae bacterium]
MHAEDRMLGVVFETTVRLVVPLFQRPYVWNEERNWEPLWDSIEVVANRRLAESTPRPHFLGAIVLEQLKTETGEVDSRQVIDGQQRLTTLQLAIAAVRDLCAEKGAEDYREGFKRLSENYVPSKKNRDSVFKVWPTNVDREHFRQVMSAGSLLAIAKTYDVKPEARDYGHLIPNCYKYFYEKAEEWLGETAGEELEDRLEILFAAFRQDLVLVVVDLDEGDDPQLIFETLNALGTPLAPADLVKNFLFHTAEQEGASITELYEETWQPFDDNVQYWRAEVRQGRLKWFRIDTFLAHYLTLLRQDVVSMTHLFTEFREHFDQEDVSAAQQVRNLRQYAKVFEGFDLYHPESREGMFFKRLEALDTSMAVPVLLEMLRSPQSDEDKEQFLQLLESYLVRRAVCCLTYKNYNRLFVDMIRSLSKAGFTSAALREFLLERKGDSTEWPTDQQFRKAFCDFPIYKRLKQSRTRMVLEGIERAMHDGKNEKISIDEQLTIEHVMPQDWRANWPMPDGSTLEDEMHREEVLQSFGNLTLVTRKLNPSMSNSAWSEKKTALQEHSALTMNRRLQKSAKWSEDTIAERSREMCEIALTIWPRPES